MPWLLGACALGPPDPKDLPDTSHLHGERYANDGSAPGFAGASGATGATGASGPVLDLPERWWHRFGDPTANQLVDDALAGNLDLRAAAARALAAQARAGVALGARRPALDLSVDGSRNFTTLADESRFYTNRFQGLGTLSWQVDLFGRLRASERARAADWMASVNDREALAHTLVASALRSRVALSVGIQRAELARDIVDSRASTLEIVEGRYARGVESASAVEVRLARENLAAARAALPEIQLELERDANALDELLGRAPGTSRADTTLATALPETAPPPLGVPAQLVDRRPDLRAAALRATAAEAEVDVAVAALWPDLTLTAQGGYEFTELFLSTEGPLGGLAGNLAMRLFNGGALRAEIDVAKAGFEEQIAAYGATVLAAVREVEDALAAERRLREQLAFVRTQAEEARMAEGLARDRYRRGIEGLLTVLETERRRSGAEDAALRLRGAVWNARIDLHLALGGDWDLEADSAGSREPGAPASADARLDGTTR